MSYYTKITKAGLAAITAAMNNNSKVPITYMAFGDGNGYIPEPDENATSLVNEVYRVGVNKVEVHNKNPNWLVCEAIIPSAVGGFNIREVALYDSTGATMLAIASYPPTYKPTVEEGAAKIQTIRIVIQVDNSGNFELIVDPDVVLATIEYVNQSNKDKAFQFASLDALLSSGIKKNGSIAHVSGLNGGKFIFDLSRENENDNISVYAGWCRNISDFVTPFMAGAKLDGSDSTAALQITLDYARINKLIVNGCGKSLKCSNVIMRNNAYLYNINLEQNNFSTRSSVLNTDYGMLDFVENITLHKVNIDGKRQFHTNIESTMDGGRCCFLVRRPINGLNIIGCNLHHAVTDALMLFPVDWALTNQNWRSFVKNIKIEDSSFNWSGRWGISADSTDGFTIANSSARFNGLDVEGGGNYTTGKSARLANGKHYGGGLVFEEYFGFSYSKNIEILNCNMLDNAGYSLGFVRTGFIEGLANKIQIIGGFFNKGTASDSGNTDAISFSLYTASGALDAFHAQISNVDLGGDNLFFSQCQNISVSNLMDVGKIRIDRSVVKSDKDYNYEIINPSYSNFVRGIKEYDDYHLGNNNKESTIWIHTLYQTGAKTHFNLRANGQNVGGISFEKAGDPGYTGVNFHFRDGITTIFTIDKNGNLLTRDNLSDIGSLENKFKKAWLNKLNLSDLSICADNTAAKNAGLGNGDVYRTSTGQLMVVF